MLKDYCTLSIASLISAQLAAGGTECAGGLRPEASTAPWAGQPLCTMVCIAQYICKGGNLMAPTIRCRVLITCLLKFLRTEMDPLTPDFTDGMHDWL